MKITKIVLAIGAAVALVLTAPVAAHAGGADKVALCHATGSETNPYVSIEVSVNAFYNAGHHTHQGGRDIVPPFPASKKMDAFPGLNWDSAGQAIFNNGCQAPEPEPEIPTKPKPITVTSEWVAGSYVCGDTEVFETRNVTNVGHKLENNVWVLNPLPTDRNKVETRTRALTDAEIEALDCVVEPPVKVYPPVIEVPEEPSYTPPVLNCPEYTVPGWLNEHGDPTSCVGDHPCPGLEAPECVSPLIETPEEEANENIVVAPDVPERDAKEYEAVEKVETLPYTGAADYLPLGALALALLIAGGFLIRKRANV